MAAGRICTAKLLFNENPKQWYKLKGKPRARARKKK